MGARARNARRGLAAASKSVLRLPALAVAACARPYERVGGVHATVAPRPRANARA